MFIGLDSNNQRIHALKAVRTNAYHCPICQQSLTIVVLALLLRNFLNVSFILRHTVVIPKGLTMYHRITLAHIRRLYSMLEPDFATKSHLSSLDNMYFSL